jgi:hypothetical protein
MLVNPVVIIRVVMIQGAPVVQEGKVKLSRRVIKTP